MMNRATDDDPAPSENNKPQQGASEVVGLSYDPCKNISLDETIKVLDDTIQAAKNTSDLETDFDSDGIVEPRSKKRKARQARRQQKRLYNVGDVVWIKHESGPKRCAWPCYIKTVRAKKLGVLYICHNTFEKGEKCFTYPVCSNKVKRFHILENIEEIEAGNKVYPDRTQDGNDFREACQLAGAYLRQRAMGRYYAQPEAIKFFKTRGIEYYLQPTESFRHLFSRSSGDNKATPSSSSSSSSSKTPAKRIAPAKPFESSIDRMKRLEDKKAKEGIEAFNKRCTVVVDYILAGNCDSIVKEIAEYTKPSSRMDEFTERWKDGGPDRMPDYLTPKSMYFYCDEQAQDVARYVRNLTDRVPRPARCPEPHGIIKQTIMVRELCLDVFYPEAVIYAIGKCFRRDRYRSVLMYKAGYSGPKSCPRSLVEFTDDEEEDGEPLRL